MKVTIISREKVKPEFNIGEIRNIIDMAQDKIYLAVPAATVDVLNRMKATDLVLESIFADIMRMLENNITDSTDAHNKINNILYQHVIDFMEDSLEDFDDEDEIYYTIEKIEGKKHLGICGTILTDEELQVLAGIIDGINEENSKNDAQDEDGAEDDELNDLLDEINDFLGLVLDKVNK